MAGFPGMMRGAGGAGMMDRSARRTAISDLRKIAAPGAAAAAPVGETAPDPADGHTHQILFLDDMKSGTTSLDGEPAHSHAIVNGEVVDAASGEYRSTHEMSGADGAAGDGAANDEIAPAGRDRLNEA